MRFLLDQDVYAITERLLRGLGHDVVTARELGLSRAADADLIALAAEQGRVFVTRDRDFGALVFLRRVGAGVVYLRMTPANAAETHDELVRMLAQHDELELRSAFVVVEPGRHRFRRV